jgi:NAD(P)-dependent dehydrogenase (short-subunit alcohol dehydrogenase family)
MKLEHKRVVILGGTSGIGFATAEAAAREGAEVVVASSRKARLDRALAALPKGASGHVLDLAHEESIRSLFGTVGPLDHLVFTAGESLALGELAATSLEDARRFFEVRYWGAVTAVSMRLRKSAAAARSCSAPAWPAIARARAGPLRRASAARWSR